MFHKLNKKGDFSCINFSCGYYNMHSTSEFVVVKDVEDALNLALGVVNELGLNKFEYTYIRPTYDYYGQGNLLLYVMKMRMMSII